ncbi:MAG: hypothetical protein GC160_14850 [Acidobacteria bacterium]|nr:hypothetical protein [Acidobacteriota bacterium]
MKITMAAAALSLLPWQGLRAEMDGSQKAGSKLQQIEAAATDIRAHAAKLKTAAFQPSMFSPEWHSYQLNAMAAESQEMGKYMKQFEALRADATARQNTAFDLAVEHGSRLADSIRKAIDIANNSRSELEVFHPDYSEAVNAIYDQADGVVAAVGLAESWDEVHEAQQTLSKL